jgi:mRNA interferase YafQ
MYKIRTTNQFEKDVARCRKRGLNLDSLQEVMNLLAQNGALPAIYKSHKLSGKFAGCWECHIKPDWLLIWQQDDIYI